MNIRIIQVVFVVFFAWINVLCASQDGRERIDNAEKSQAICILHLMQPQQCQTQMSKTLSSAIITTYEM